MVFDQPQVAPIPPRVVDVGLHGRIEEDDEARYRATEVVREATWRREGQCRYYAVRVAR